MMTWQLLVCLLFSDGAFSAVLVVFDVFYKLKQTLEKVKTDNDAVYKTNTIHRLVMLQSPKFYSNYNQSEKLIQHLLRFSRLTG